ncbi:MAG: hypothetical protein GEV03_13300 [Streptosporangiales bacterium]|nr:hypothetical protein [Streptosporangiales bacterium]
MSRGVATAVLASLAACTTGPGLGDEVDVDVTVLGGSGGLAAGQVGVTPLDVRRGKAADLAGHTYTNDDGEEVKPPDGTPYYLDVRMVNKSDAEMTSGPRVYGIDTDGAELEDLNDLTLWPPFTPCPKHNSDSEPFEPGVTYTACHVFVVRSGEELDRVTVGDTQWRVK